ncbi:MAG: hypothetical protein HQL36_10715 [Alphaproteobacteria bacterium]|nr:hypothetical protein [Alphaproteobacteria bacterium]
MMDRANLSRYRQSLTARVAALCVAGAVLASCYMPARFDAEIELDRQGYYSLKFDGYMVDVGLYKGLVIDKTVSPAEEKEKAAIIERDFRRETSTKDFKYYREGHFKVNWERSGDLLDVKTVTFVRRNELIFHLKYVENSGYIVMEGKSLTKDNRQRLKNMGLDTNGQIRVKTDMPIKSHNAHEEKKDPRDPRYKWLVWNISTIMQGQPRAIFIIE